MHTPAYPPLSSDAAAINTYVNGASIERMLPTGPRTMELHYTYLFREGLSPAEAEATKAGRYAFFPSTVLFHPLQCFLLLSELTDSRSKLLTVEDKAICEAVQRNLAGGAYERGPLRHEVPAPGCVRLTHSHCISPRHENGVYAFQEWLRQARERGKS